jgi:hypothetical protein
MAWHSNFLNCCSFPLPLWGRGIKGERLDSGGGGLRGIGGFYFFNHMFQNYLKKITFADEKSE